MVANLQKSSSQNGYTATVLNVGQGQSIVISSGDYTAVIDCGSSSGEDAGSIAEQYIRSLGRDSIDVLMLTHYHSDHANGVRWLLSSLDVGALVVPEPNFEESTLDDQIIATAQEVGADVVYVDEDLTLTLGDTEIYLYAPMGKESENERGVSMLISENDFEVLVTGDIDSSLELELLRNEDIPDIECLVVGHHGSKYSTSELLLTLTKPEIGVISVGNNTYGHPTEETLSRLEDADVQIYRTDIDGNITIHSD
jgi:competence protein ComEC